MDVVRMRFSNRVWFGPGCTEKLEEESKTLGAKHVLVISDEGIKNAGLLEHALAPLQGAGAEVEAYIDVTPEPPIEDLEKCFEAYRKENFDLVVGVGGGSPLDVAKSMSVLLANGGEARDYLGIDLVPNPGLPSILIPTTAGTGAEATPNAIFSIEEEKVKKAIVSSHIIANVAVLDPDLTLGLPPAQTAASGVDALTHCLETYVALNATPISEMFSIEGMRLIAGSIRRAVHNGKDLKARADMLLGSYYGRDLSRRGQRRGDPCTLVSVGQPVPCSPRRQQRDALSPCDGVQLPRELGKVRQNRKNAGRGGGRALAEGSGGGLG